MVRSNLSLRETHTTLRETVRDLESKTRSTMLTELNRLTRTIQGRAFYTLHHVAGNHYGKYRLISFLDEASKHFFASSFFVVEQGHLSNELQYYQKVFFEVWVGVHVFV